jgi:O-succinylbenzoic acid--CoA ligase
LPDNVVTTYGMTETGSGVVYNGLPLAGVDIQIDDGGQILLRGPMLFRAYRRAAATAADLPSSDPTNKGTDPTNKGTDPTNKGRWFATGDAGMLDESGRLTVLGRLDDLIITGGENVWPIDVEHVLLGHPAIADVAVLGRPDPEWGQRVVAYVVAQPTGPSPTLDGLRAWVKERLPAWAAPRQVVLVDSLPRTELGKVRKGALPVPARGPD